MIPHETLKTALSNAVASLGLPLGWEGDVFTPPLAPHVRGRIVYEDAQTVSLGPHGLIRQFGYMEVKVVGPVASGEIAARNPARHLAAMFPRGSFFECDNGEITLMTATIGTAVPDGSRISVPVKIPFYVMSSPSGQE